MYPRKTLLLPSLASAIFAFTHFAAADPALVLTDQVGYDPLLPKHAVIRGVSSDNFSKFAIQSYPEGKTVLEGEIGQGTSVDHWKNWKFWRVDFDALQTEGSYVIECSGGQQTVRSFPFRVQKNVLERHTLGDVLFYLKSQRCSGPLDRADRTMTFLTSSHPGTADVHGGWYDASGDYGKHLSHLSFSTFHNPQQTPFVVYSLLKTSELLEKRGDDNFKQDLRRIQDEALYGADFLVRMRVPNSSFYQTISGRGPGKKPEDRRITPALDKGFSIKKAKPAEADFQKQSAAEAAENRAEVYEVSFRGGGGVAIAALAMASKSPIPGEFTTADYLRNAEQAFAFLDKHNPEITSDGHENIVDDYCALLAATELFRATSNPEYSQAAQKRANNLIGRLITRDTYHDYWRANDEDRPFFHAADAGLPVVSLLYYREIADEAMKAKISDAVRHSLEFELSVTGEVPNPFGLARQYVQSKAGKKRTTFFYPHDADTAPWWQGENARLASLSAAARLAAPLFQNDAAFQRRLQDYAASQLHWILGLNPFDACLLQGNGRNNPEYLFFGTYQYRGAPGGICNGITSGFKDESDIDFNLSSEVTGTDDDWRWGEQWLPHAAWYLLAVASGSNLH